MSDRISRRSMIAGFATGAAVAITPAVMASPLEAEDPATRVERLAHELSEALDGYCRGKFRAVVEPASKADGMVLFEAMSTRRFDLQRWLDTADDRTVLEYHALQLGHTMMRIHPGHVNVNLHTGIDIVSVVRHASGSPGVFLRCFA